jgi:release factor glutamine methyltransferase
VLGDWGASVAGAFDVIVANPPYIPSADIPALQPEVARYEPRLALDGGPDGLDAFRAIAPQIARLLSPSGVAIFEFGAGQEGAVRAVLAGAGLKPEQLYLDLSGVPRAWTVRT